jgi:hypothetical protein
MTNQEQILQRIGDRRADLARRRREIARTIELLRAEDAEIERKDAALLITAQTLPDVLVNPEREPLSIGDVVGTMVSSLETATSAPKRKPEGLPSILEMASEALATFELDGVEWLTPPEIARYISTRWWPDVKTEFISPQLWRAAVRGDLLKSGPRYARKNTTRHEKGPATEVARPSQTNGAADWPSA